MLTKYCKNCGKEIQKTKSDAGKSKHSFCSHSCRATYYNKLRPARKLTNVCAVCGEHIRSDRKHCSGCYSRNKGICVNCNNCGKPVIKTPSLIKKSKTGKHFCSLSCRATYHNLEKTFKRKGAKRSNIEFWLEKKIAEEFSELTVLFNRADIIKDELDIYIPSIKLAFEINGIFHYQPIFGEEKLKQTKVVDGRKVDKCHKVGIDLCVIDISSMGNFNEKDATTYLNMIRDKINIKISS